MIDDLYSARILTLAANLPHAGRLASPEGTGERVAKLCGSRASLISSAEAAAGVLGQSVLGASADEIREARDAMTAMLKSGGEGPVGRFEGLRVLKQVADYPARHASTLVAIEATLEAVDQALAGRTRLAGAA
jgi:NifU-like protein involved in Fe-S cluster formation